MNTSKLIAVSKFARTRESEDVQNFISILSDRNENKIGTYG